MNPPSSCPRGWRHAERPAARAILGALIAIAGPADSGGVAAAPDSAPFYADTFDKHPSPAALTALGRLLFFDPGLSASGKLSCAGCHDPQHGFGPPDAVAVRRGGRDGRQPGVRAAPSLTYTENIPAFTEHFFDDDGDDSVDQGPAGGRTWDGRSGSAHDQARLPLLSPFEMANADPADVVSKVHRAAYAAEFRDTFGQRVFESSAAVFKGVLLALETYQQRPEDFYPYNSKYDAWLRHGATLTAEEARGLAAFNDPAKGNCARCHPSNLRNGAFPQFTDFGYAALGVPRNPGIPANSDPRYHDLGLCGPLRTDLIAQTRYCGLFRTPSLRNVALRGVYFHNGKVTRLAEAVRFYAERDTNPENWYPPGADRRPVKFDDLPEAYRENVDREPPFGRAPGAAPAIDARDVRDIVAFLHTLTDGYDSRVAAPPARHPIEVVARGR